MNLEVDEMLLPLGLVLTRVGTFVAVCPTFISDTVSPAIRGTVAGMLSLVLTLSLESFTVPHSLIAAMGVELLVGGMLAASVRLTATSIGFAGELFDLNLGYGFARQMNPMLGEEATPLMQLSQWLSGLLFFVAGGQRYVIEGLAASCRLLPPGAGGVPSGWPRLFSEHLADIVQTGLLLAVPIVLTMMCTQLGLALLSRLAPSLNIWAIGLLGTCGMGLLSLWCFLPAYVQAILALWRNQAPFSSLLLMLGASTP